MQNHQAKLETTDVNGNTPLLTASSSGNANAVDLLLAAGANPAAKNYQGFAAVDLICYCLSDYRSLPCDVGRCSDQGGIRAKFQPL